jgi:8-oxo-dGTP pyrophosphatase MutT (NUDIX family)
MKVSRPTLFVGCSSESLPIAEALQDALSPSVEVRPWSQGLFRAGRLVLEELEEVVKRSHFAAFVWAGDDATLSRGDSHSSARDNVVLETGLFLGVLGRQRIFILVPDTGVRIPSDLDGLIYLAYSEPSDGNWVAALGPAARNIKKLMSELGPRQSSDEPMDTAPKVFSDLDSAMDSMRADAMRSTGIRILANRGLVFLGTDESVIPLHEAKRFESLRKLRLILLGPKSRWIHEGLVQLRAHESLETFLKSLRSGHEVVELALSRFNKLRGAPVSSAVRYHRGEPTFRMLITDDAAYVSSYAEHPSRTARYLPVYRFPHAVGSLYASYKRYFNDLWHNQSSSGAYELQNVDLKTSAGGIVTVQSGGDLRYLLLQRNDGFWVLPKGHRRADGEDIKQTAQREVSEETGIPEEALTISRYLGEYTFDEGTEEFGERKVIHLFHMTVGPEVAHKARPVDHAAAEWFSASGNLPAMRYSYQKSFLHELLSALGQKGSEAR